MGLQCVVTFATFLLQAYRTPHALPPTQSNTPAEARGEIARAQVSFSVNSFQVFRNADIYIPRSILGHQLTNSERTD